MGTNDLSERLLKDERIVWWGAPASGLLLTGRDALLIPFSLLWGGFAIFWTASVMTQPRGSPMFALWGIPFVLIGLYVIAGRFVVDAWIRRGMSYALTNQRILIQRPWPFGKFTALRLDQLPEASLTESADGRGTIRFGQQPPLWGRGTSWTPSLDPTPQFIAIENARSVFDQIQQSTRRRA